MKSIAKIFGLLKTSVIETKDELLGVCSDVACEQLKRDTLLLERDAKIQMIQDEYDSRVLALTTGIDANVKRITAWAVIHREMFHGKQTLALAGHLLEFRKSPGAITTVEDIKLDDVVEKLINLQGEGAEELREMILRVEAALDKKATLREWRLNREGMRDKLKELGLTLRESESFSFTPARQELPEIREVAAAAA